MKMKDLLSEQDLSLFKEAVNGIKPLTQDKVTLTPQRNKQKRQISKTNDKLPSAEFHFSDEFEPHILTQGPMKYVREGVDHYEVKCLRRGDYVPDLILDLHGLTQSEAKRELAALLYACQKEHAKCICIVHGIGSRVLKNKVPHWLVQHPDVMAFHQAPLEWGGDGAILALIELKDKDAYKSD